MNQNLTRTEQDRLATAALVALMESSGQMKHDLGGEQANWHIPRVGIALTNLMTLFPEAAGRAVEQAKRPSGDPIMSTSAEAA